MPRLSPAVAETRNALRFLTRVQPGQRGPLVFVACSGGPDSMALAAAAAFMAPRYGWRAGLITVDHQLQDGSGEQAAAVAKWADAAGFDPVLVTKVDVGADGGPEAAARTARYAALASAATAHGASSVLLGHTLDDQAETVLLALTRGAGPRGLSGMPATRTIHGVTFHRPLLGLSRSLCRAACADQGLSTWDDPHNVDPAFTRSRLRPLVQALGPDIVANLARSAELIARDSGYLDEISEKALEACRAGAGLSVTELAALAPAIRSRVLHLWITELGAPRASLSHRHLAALDALITAWRGQGDVSLPGTVTVHRSGPHLLHRP
jgi:tRNA(Ile)-lysidine synthase